MTSIVPETGTPWIIAHRGARDEAPENTCSAFERALTYPIDGIELDVQMSRDGLVVVYHDWTIRRLARRGRYVFALDREELAALDWGAWFHPDFAGEPMPTLGGILSRLGPRTRWLIEIKSHPADTAWPWWRNIATPCRRSRSISFRLTLKSCCRQRAWHPGGGMSSILPARCPIPV